VDDGATDPGVARAGAAVAARRQELGISQRELARRKIITAPALSAFERGRSWPRERTRHTLEELLQWPAGTIARVRAGAPPPDSTTPQSENGDASLVVDALTLALAQFDVAIEDLPRPIEVAFVPRATTILVDLNKLERLAVRAIRHSQGAPAVINALSSVRRRYNELMLRAAQAPGATLGQRLYAARHRARLSTGEAAALLDATPELVEALEAGQPVDPTTSERVGALLEQWSKQE
jgi:transcriptional regulator with XRE-family HTH domain